MLALGPEPLLSDRSDVTAEAAASNIAASMFWPPAALHRIATIPLDVDLADPLLLRHAGSILELSSLADAIRALQREDGSFVNEEVAQAALRRSAAVLRAMAVDLPEPAAGLARLRADGLARGDTRHAALREAAEGEGELTLLCGGITTWRRKSKRRFHGFIAAVPSQAAATVQHRPAARWLDSLRALVGVR
jgi:hypothetical protein